MSGLTYIGWLHFHRRAQLLAQHLCATLHFVQSGHQGKVLEAPFRYVVQGLRTWRILRAERPDVVLVQNPPIFLALLVAFYGWWHGARYVIDSHTAAFASSKWRWSLWLHRLLSKGAATTLVHNKAQEGIVRHWGSPYMLLAYTPGDYQCNNEIHLDGEFSVVVISSFLADERPGVVIEAARHLPDIQFYLTGDARRVPSSVLARMPANCHLTGYLPYDRYACLLQAADATMALTARDNTLLMGGFEAVCVGKPLITSDWPVLKDYFHLGTVHVPYTVEGICHGVRRTKAEQAALQLEMLRLRRELDEEWQLKLAELRGLLAGKC